MIGKSFIGQCVVAFAPDTLQLCLASATQTVASIIASAGADKRWLAENIAPGWRLIRPVLLSVEEDEDGECIVSDSFSTVYGNGENSKSAVADYCEALIGYYEILEEHRGDNVSTAVQFISITTYLAKS